MAHAGITATLVYIDELIAVSAPAGVPCAVVTVPPPATRPPGLDRGEEVTR